MSTIHQVHFVCCNIGKRKTNSLVEINIVINIYLVLPNDAGWSYVVNSMSYVVQICILISCTTHGKGKLLFLHVNNNIKKTWCYLLIRLAPWCKWYCLHFCRHLYRLTMIHHVFLCFKYIKVKFFFLHNHGENMWGSSCGADGLPCNVHIWWFASRQWKQQLFGIIGKSRFPTKWVWLYKRSLHGSILQWQNTGWLHW